MIRPAEDGDLGAIERMWNHVVRTSLATFNSKEKTHAEIAATLRERRDAGHAVLVADRGDGPIAFGMYFQFRGGLGYQHTLEHTIIVDEAAKGQGIGRVLLTALEDHARAAGHHSLFAGVSGRNPDGRAFHAAMGYIEVVMLKEVGRKWDQWLDLHLMQKFL
ncbi:MAG: N-acetyltransferase family protein [Pseudomonadota bacterium]